MCQSQKYETTIFPTFYHSIRCFAIWICISERPWFEVIHRTHISNVKHLTKALRNGKWKTQVESKHNGGKSICVICHHRWLVVLATESTDWEMSFPFTIFHFQLLKVTVYILYSCPYTEYFPYRVNGFSVVDFSLALFWCHSLWENRKFPYCCCVSFGVTTAVGDFLFFFGCFHSKPKKNGMFVCVALFANEIMSRQQRQRKKKNFIIILHYVHTAVDRLIHIICIRNI